MAFTYLDSWEDAIGMLPDEQQAEARLAIITYGLKGEIMDGISPTSKAIVMLVKPSQLANAEFPILVTLLGISMLIKLEQQENAAYPILVTL